MIFFMNKNKKTNMQNKSINFYKDLKSTIVNNGQETLNSLKDIEFYNDFFYEKHCSKNRFKEGPFDISEVVLEKHSYINFINYGSIIIPKTVALNPKVEIEKKTNRILSLNFHDNDSMLQIQAFSAPKSEGVWLKVKKQIEINTLKQGGKIKCVDGKFGQEIIVLTPNMLKTQKYPIRFIGVDGPRWFLRGVFSGESSVNYQLADTLNNIFLSVIVNRGNDPMPPEKLLPLKIPNKNNQSY